MAGTAGSGFFHFSHGEVPAVFQAEYSLVADFTIVVVFIQMKFVTEYNRLGIIERELHILGFAGGGANYGE
jgi:hypothetical protein